LIRTRNPTSAIGPTNNKQKSQSPVRRTGILPVIPSLQSPVSTPITLPNVREKTFRESGEKLTLP